jgi:hypothetical protein
MIRVNMVMSVLHLFRVSLFFEFHFILKFIVDVFKLLLRLSNTRVVELFVVARLLML